MLAGKRFDLISDERAFLRQSVEELATSGPAIYRAVMADLDGVIFFRRDLVARAIFRAMVSTASRQERAESARVLQQLGAVALEGDDLISAIEALQDAEALVVCAALACLVQSNLEKSNEAEKAIVKSMRHQEAQVRLGSLRAVRQLGADQASGTLSALTNALHDRERDVRIEALSVFAWLGGEAESAADVVVGQVLNETDEVVRDAAIRALLAIDPESRRALSLMGSVQDNRKREDLLLLLRHVGPEARTLRHLLQAQWNPAPHPDGPHPPGTFWWQGESFGMEPIPCKLLCCVWEKETVPLSQIAQQVWGKSKISQSTIKAALSKVNHVLLRACTHRQYGQSGDNIVKK